MVERGSLSTMISVPFRSLSPAFPPFASLLGPPGGTPRFAGPLSVSGLRQTISKLIALGRPSYYASNLEGSVGSSRDRAGWCLLSV